MEPVATTEKPKFCCRHCGCGEYTEYGLFYFCSGCSALFVIPEKFSLPNISKQMEAELKNLKKVAPPLIDADKITDGDDRDARRTVPRIGYT